MDLLRGGGGGEVTPLPGPPGQGPDGQCGSAHGSVKAQWSPWLSESYGGVKPAGEQPSGSEQDK